uniref:Uncharacterized protein n=1 Tax=Anguilla anguilla TaxID=7936 RepID=A0A0E9VIA0_ANGAN
MNKHTTVRMQNGKHPVQVQATGIPHPTANS